MFRQRYHSVLSVFAIMAKKEGLVSYLCLYD